MRVETLVAFTRSLACVVLCVASSALGDPPLCSLSLSPSSGPAGKFVVAQSTVTPGTFPGSTGLAVSLDAGIVGAGILPMLDDGIAPDATAGDNMFTTSFSVSPSVSPGTYVLPAVVSDAQARTSSCNATFFVPPGVSGGPIASDGFDYTPTGSAVGSYTLPRGVGFTGTWYEQLGTWSVESPSLTFTDGVRTLRSTGGKLRTTSAEARRNMFLPGGPLGNNTSTMWVSLLVRQTGGTAANSFGGLTLPTGLGTGLFVGKPFNQSSWGIENAPGPILTSGISTSATAFLVLRIDFQPGPDDVWMWVNPSLATTPSVGTANVSAPGFGNFENIRILLLHAGATGAGSITMEADEVRVGYSFPDVAPYSLPANDECAGAASAILGSNAFDLSNATASAGAVCAPIGPDTWYAFTAPATGRFTIDTCRTASFDTVLALYDACGGTLLACNDDSCGVQSGISFCGTAGTTYLLRVGGFGGAAGYGSFFITQGDPDDAGETPATFALSLGANPIVGTIGDGCGDVNDADVYAIAISDPANFVATTVGGASFDTQLFLFDASGLGIAANDDSPAGGLQSTITGAFVPGPGLYFLAISAYDKDPIDASAAALWLDMPFNVERAPDGPGGANPWAGFDSSSTAGGPYSIFMLGTSNPAKPSKCLSGWLGMDDVCPTGAVGGQEIYDYSKGSTSSGAMLSTPVPYSESRQFVDNSLHFGLKPGGSGLPPQPANTYLNYRVASKTQFAISTGAAGGFTAMAWINPDVDSTTEVTLIDLLGNSTGGIRLFLSDDAGPGMKLNAEVKMSSAAAMTFPPSNSSIIIMPGHWTHVSISVSWGTTASSGAVRLDAAQHGASSASTYATSTSLTVGQCSNLNLAARVGARAGSTATQFYKGFFDEFQLYSCSLSAPEVTQIQAAGSAGVAKDKVFAPWETGSQTESNIVDVAGVLIVDRQGQPADPLPNYLLSYSPTPSGGAAAYCNSTPFPVATFTPLSAVLPSVPRGITPFQLHVDTDPIRFIGHACFNVYATNMSTGISTAAMGSVVDHPVWWADLDRANPNNTGHPLPGPDTFGFKEAALATPTTWHFRLSNSSSTPRFIQYKVAAMSADMSMAPVPVTLSLGAGVLPGLCPTSGNPVCGSITVPANSTATLPIVTATINAAPGTEDIFEVTLYADIDGSGSISATEDLASAGMMARLMPMLASPPCSCFGSCVADFDDGSGTGVPDGGVTIDDLLYYLGIFEAGASCCDVDDGSGTGKPDGGVTIDDLLYYLIHFEAGC